MGWDAVGDASFDWGKARIGRKNRTSIQQVGSDDRRSSRCMVENNACLLTSIPNFKISSRWRTHLFVDRCPQ